MNELEEKIATLRIKRTLKNIAKQQIGYNDLTNIVQWQLRDRGKFIPEEIQLMTGLQVKYN